MGHAGDGGSEEFFTHLILILVVITLVTPFIYVISASFKDSKSIFAYPPSLLPIPPYTGNYERLITETGFVRWIANTFFVATVVTVLKVFLDSMAGYALAKLQFRGKRFVFASLLILLMVPLGVLIVPLWTVAHTLGINDTYLALILPPLANPLGVFLMRQFILSLPNDLENAARLDGVSEFGIYRRIILPLVKPGLVVLAIIVFTDQFMSFIWPLVSTSSDDLQVLTVGLAVLPRQGRRGLRDLVRRRDHVARPDRDLLLRAPAPVPRPEPRGSPQAVTERSHARFASRCPLTHEILRRESERSSHRRPEEDPWSRMS